MSDFKKSQIEKQIEKLHLPIFEEAKNQGSYNGKQYPHVLASEDRIKNLYAPIRQDALAYFERYGIAWWSAAEDGNFPTGDLLSSQIHCLNHLFAIRKDKDAVLSMIQPVGEQAGVHFDDVLPSPVDTEEAGSGSNFISFEFVCHNRFLLNETYESRGEKCTSVDAFVYAKAGEEYWLIPIEWKYTEAYPKDGKDACNFERYRCFVSRNSRLQGWAELFKKEPFYQLGRQTLLMERLIAEYQSSKDCSQYPLKADKFLHLIVVPEGNTDMRFDVERFQRSVKEPMRRYCILLSPEKLLLPITENGKYASLVEYLKLRYWS